MADAGCAGRRGGEGEPAAGAGQPGRCGFAGLNGVSFYFMRGKICEMPVAVMEILKSCGEM